MINLIKKLASWLLPLVAAFAKALGNVYGTFLLYCFLITGSLSLSIALFNPVIASCLIACAISVFLVCCLMEGRALAKNIGKKIGLDNFEIRYFWKKLRQRYPQLWQLCAKFGWLLGYLFAPLTYLLGYLIPTLAAMAKGANMAAGTIGTLTLVFFTLGLITTPSSWIIATAIIFSLGVFGASFCKEGVTFRRKFFSYLLPKNNIITPFAHLLTNFLLNPLKKGIKKVKKPLGQWQRRQPWLNKPLDQFLKGIALIFPWAAAFGKALGNGFGTINFLNMYFNLPAITSALSLEPMILIPYLVILSVVGITVLIDSLCMEGAYLKYYLYKWFDNLIGVQTPHEKLHFEMKFAAHTIAHKIATAKHKEPNKYITPPSLTVRLLNGIAWIAPVIAGLAKGCTMGSGIAGILFLLCGLPGMISTLGIIIGSIALFCGVTVALVSIFKEGAILKRHLSQLLTKYIEGKEQLTYGARYKHKFMEFYQELFQKILEEDQESIHQLENRNNDELAKLYLESQGSAKIAFNFFKKPTDSCEDLSKETNFLSPSTNTLLLSL